MSSRSRQGRPSSACAYCCSPRPQSLARRTEVFLVSWQVAPGRCCQIVKVIRQRGMVRHRTCSLRVSGPISHAIGTGDEIFTRASGRTRKKTEKQKNNQREGTAAMGPHFSGGSTIPGAQLATTIRNMAELGRIGQQLLEAHGLRLSPSAWRSSGIPCPPPGPWSLGQAIDGCRPTYPAPCILHR